MTISNVRCEIKKEQLCSTCPEQVIGLNLIVTVQNGEEEFINVPVNHFVNEIFDYAITEANKHLEKSKRVIKK